MSCFASEDLAAAIELLGEGGDEIRVRMDEVPRLRGATVDIWVA